MFSNLFFLLLNLLLFTIAEDQTAWPVAAEAPFVGLAFGLIFYFLILVFLYYQSKILHPSRFRQETILLISNIELLICFSLEYFVFGSARQLIFWFYPVGHTVTLVFFLFLYFMAIHICQNPIKKNNDALLASLRFLFPFAIPFLIIIFLIEIEPFFLSLLGKSLNDKVNDSLQTAFLITINICIFFLAILFFPPVAVYLWDCPKLTGGRLVDQLNEVCRRTNFRHAGLKVWTVMKNASTAAIIGVISHFRYILFTEQLLNELSPRAVAAVLAHEIGHSKKHHLWIYPFIFLGMAAASTLVLMFLESIFSDQMGEAISGKWQAVKLILFFFCFAISVALYFRFVFGYFSRLFEREADLYVLEIGIPASDMIEALDTLGVVYGNIHQKPNWHHFSINERIECLKNAEADPQVISKHRFLTRLSFLLYVLCLILMMVYLFS